MTAAGALPRRAFAVWWKDLERWSVGAFRAPAWRWPREQIKPLSAALERRSERVNKKTFELRPEHFVSLRFTGEIEPRDLHGKADFKGSLFHARAGDILYSKIDVRNGAIGIVPDALPLVAVTSEFPVYRIRPEAALSEYVQLVFRTANFRGIINGMVSGASGRKRVQPDDLERVEIPLPPLAEQAAIVARWREAQTQISAACARVEAMETKLPGIVYRDLGTPPPSADKPLAKWFVLPWKELERWSFNYLSRSRQGLLGFSKSKFPIVPLGEHLIETMNGYCIKPVAGPTPHKMLKLNALAPAGLDLDASKFIRVPDRIAERFSIRKDDVLICRSNAYEYVAKCALVREDKPGFLFPDIMIRARVKDSVLPEFVTEVIQTPLGRSYFQINSRRAVGGMWKISADDILNFPIPLPPLPVQREIVARVAAGRAEIAREREAAARLAREIEAETEARILGTSKA
jgi:type I restriction enzyme S subunit